MGIIPHEHLNFPFGQSENVSVFVFPLPLGVGDSVGECAPLQSFVVIVAGKMSVGGITCNVADAFCVRRGDEFPDSLKLRPERDIHLSRSGCYTFESVMANILHCVSFLPCVRLKYSHPAFVLTAIKVQGNFRFLVRNSSLNITANLSSIA